MRTLLIVVLLFGWSVEAHSEVESSRPKPRTFHAIRKVRKQHVKPGPALAATKATNPRKSRAFEGEHQAVEAQKIVLDAARDKFIDLVHQAKDILEELRSDPNNEFLRKEQERIYQSRRVAGKEYRTMQKIYHTVDKVLHDKQRESSAKRSKPSKASTPKGRK